MTNDKCLCIYCGKQYVNKSTLMKHAVIHTQTKIMEKKVKQKIYCILCGKAYTSMASLTKHEHMYKQQEINQKVEIVKPALLQCEFCKYESNRKSSIDM